MKKNSKLKYKNKTKISNKNKTSINIKIDNSRKTRIREPKNKFKHPQLYTPQPAQTVYNHAPILQPQNNLNVMNELQNNQQLLLKNQEEHARHLNNLMDGKYDEFSDRFNNLLIDDRREREDFVNNLREKHEQQNHFNNRLTNKLEEIHKTTHDKYAEIASGVNSLYDNTNIMFNRLNEIPNELLGYIPNYDNTLNEINQKISNNNKSYLLNDGDVDNPLNNNKFKSNDKLDKVKEKAKLWDSHFIEKDGGYIPNTDYIANNYTEKQILPVVNAVKDDDKQTINNEYKEVYESYYGKEPDSMPKKNTRKSINSLKERISLYNTYYQLMMDKGQTPISKNEFKSSVKLKTLIKNLSEPVKKNKQPIKIKKLNK